jgi:hypothetical protein
MDDPVLPDLTALAQFAMATTELVSELVKAGMDRKDAVRFAAIYLANLQPPNEGTHDV